MKPHRGRIELRHLRVFEAVARLRSFTRAADELNITQPALSRTVRQLEHALGASSRPPWRAS
jgi:DNA-binding transcriptional LysR family regulator